MNDSGTVPNEAHITFTEGEAQIVPMAKSIRTMLAKTEAALKLWEYLALRIKFEARLLAPYSLLLVTTRDAAFDALVIGIDKVFRPHRTTVSLPALLKVVRNTKHYVTEDELRACEGRLADAEQIALHVRVLRDKWVAHQDRGEDINSIRSKSGDPRGEEIGQRVRSLLDDGWFLLQVLAPYTTWVAKVREADPGEELRSLLELANGKE